MRKGNLFNQRFFATLKMTGLMFLLFLMCGEVFVQADVSLSKELLQMTNLYSLEFSTNVLKKNIVSRYCDFALSDSGESGALVFSGEFAHWDSRESLFVLALCKSWGSDKVEQEKLDLLFTKDFQKKFGLQQMSRFTSAKDECVAGEQTNYCDVSRYAEKIFTKLMNELFILKWASSLQVVDPGTFSDKDQRIINFVQTYFFIGDASKYQNDYPQTAAMIDQNQKEMLSRIKGVNVLQVPLSGLVLSGDIGLDQYFISFITNEYLNYSLFVDFYTRWLSMEPSSSSEKEQYLLEIQIMNQQRQQLKQALEVALREWQEFTASYPMHVGLVWYQEALVKLRDRASKMLPPFYALYEKLRNVQAPAFS